MSLLLVCALPVRADLALATSKNCMSCHAVERKLLGPSFKAVADRYRGQKTAPEQLAAKIRSGGAGAWGPIPMPANTQVNEADARKLAIWVLSTS